MKLFLIYFVNALLQNQNKYNVGNILQSRGGDLFFDGFYTYF